MHTTFNTRFGRNARSFTAQAGLALDEAQLRRLTPSVFAETAHVSRSERYAYIPTWEVLQGLQREGFGVFEAKQGRSRTEGKEAYTKHMLRLRHSAAISRAREVGDVINEIILINSHDGTSSYIMFAGCFRLVCLNGLMVADEVVGQVRVKHSGDVRAEVIQGAFQIMDSFARVDESRDAYRALQLTSGEQEVFATAAIALRYPDKYEAPVRADQVNAPRRLEDRGDDLWATFNRAQENLVRGGLRTADRRRRTHTREVNGIDGSVALNRGLWVLAEGMRKLKGAN